jgi:hypothetical protein
MSPAQDVAAIVDAVRARRSEIGTLTILWLDPLIMTPVAVSSDGLETFPGVHREVINDIQTIDDSLAALAKSRPVGDANEIDARFALLYDSQLGERILSVYEDSFPSSGQIDDVPCVFQEIALQEWFAWRFPHESL